MKKLLCILELENTLLMTKNLNSPYKVFGGSAQSKPFDVTKEGAGIHFRRGREDLLQAMFKRVSLFSTDYEDYGLCCLDQS